MGMLTQQAFEQQYKNKHPIEGADLSAIEWHYLDAAELHIKNCHFTKTRFVETYLEGARFENCVFLDCGFPRSHLERAVFTNCNFFAGAEAKGCDFSHANMREINFRNSNLSTCLFKGAMLHEASFTDCKVQGADFEQATFTHFIGGRRGSGLTRAYLHNSNFDLCRLKGLSFESCSLTGSSFRQADLSNCNFAEADMSECDLTNAEIRNACFEQTDLRGAILEGFSLSKLTSFHNMKISQSAQEHVLSGIGIQVFP